MPMTVMNNNTAAMALGELNKNTSKLGKDLQKISSGKRINSAANGASEYSVGKKMEVMIRSLGQDIINTQTGRDLIKVAEGGIQEIVDIIRNMKEMALNSANDHNTDLDRATLQKEFNQRIHEISNIAGTTNYNGRLLLNGDYSEGYSSSRKLVSTSYVVNSTTDITDKLPAHTIPTCNPYVSEPTNLVTTIPSGNYTITQNGVYKLSPDYSGTITVAAQNVEICSELFKPYHEGTYIQCVNSNTHLWLRDLCIENWIQRSTIDRSIVKFTGSGNTLNLGGQGTLTGQGKTTACINVGDGLEIFDAPKTQSYQNIWNIGGTSNTVFHPEPNQHWDACGAAIGSDKGEMSNADIIINYSGYLNAYASRTGAGIGSGENGSIGNIIINSGDIQSLGDMYSAGIGTGYNGTVLGNIEIYGGDVTADIQASDDGDASTTVGYPSASAAGIGCGIHGTVQGSINILGGDVRAINFNACGAGIGTAGDSSGDSSIGGIKIANCKLYAKSYMSEGVGKGINPLDPACQAPWTQISEAEKFRSPTQLVGSIGSIDISNGLYSRPWDIDSETHYHLVQLDGSSSQPTPITTTYQVNRYEESGYDYHSLIIHTGPKANLNLQVFINSMHPIAMGMIGISVNPRENAVKSLEKLDNALEYALKEQTKMGAYQMRLSETEETLVAAQENTTSAESVLTDADMAKEMNEFTKDNVLSQAAQAMLSQEQKNAGAVLQMLE